MTWRRMCSTSSWMSSMMPVYLEEAHTAMGAVYNRQHCGSGQYGKWQVPRYTC